jgi:hypothetical protein
VPAAVSSIRVSLLNLLLSVQLEKMMRKLVALLAVLALTAPMFADVTITLSESGGVVTVGYDASGAGGVLAGLGFEVTLSDGVLIAGIDDFQEGDNTAAGQGYGIYPGSVDIDTSGETPVVNSWGTPIDMTAPSLGGLNSSGMSIAMGALFETGNEPATSGTLFTFTYDCNGATSFSVTVAADGTRSGDAAGGAVLLDGTNEAIVCSGLTVDCEGACPALGTAEQQAMWNSLGQPALWCGDCWLCGDVSNDCLVTFADVLQVFTYKAAGDYNGDTTMDGLLTFADVLQVFNMKNAGGCAQAGCSPCTPLVLP